MTGARAAMGPLSLLLAAVCATIVFLPPEGRIGVPLHDFVTMLLGPTTFALPLGLAFVGVLMTLQSVRPQTVLPARRLAGVALVAIGVIAAEYLLGGVSLAGRWLIGWAIDALGAALTSLLVLAVIAVGAWLTFDIRLPKRRKPDVAAS